MTNPKLAAQKIARIAMRASQRAFFSPNWKTFFLSVPPVLEKPKDYHLVMTNIAMEDHNF